MWQRAMTQGGGGGGTANCYQVFSHNGQLNYVVVKDGEIVHYSYYSNPTSNKTYEDDYLKVVFGDTATITLKQACTVDDYGGATLTPTTTTYSGGTNISKADSRLLNIQF